MRVVSVAFAALLPDAPEAHGGGDAARARWTPYHAARDLAFDHDRILADARDRIGAKLEYTGLATAFCPPEFTLGELQQVYETVWGTTLDRPNFRRKVLATPASSRPSPAPRASPAAGASPPRSTARAPPPPSTRPCSGPSRKDVPHDHDHRHQARRDRSAHRTRPRGRAGLPHRVQRRPLDPRHVR